MEDVSRLLDALQALVDAGNTVLVIEHNTDVIKVADHVVDLGPEGGEGGGQIVGIGTQSTLRPCKHPLDESFNRPCNLPKNCRWLCSQRHLHSMQTFFT